MRGHRHHRQLAALALTATVALVGCGGGDGSSSDDAKDEKGAKDAKPSKSSGTPGHKAGGAIPTKGVVVKAWCAVPANKPADVVVEAWDPDTWKQVATTKFTLPPTTVLRDDEDARTPLAELCEEGVVDPSDVGSEDEGPEPFAEPRVRQLFNDDYTKLAVVLQDPKTKGTRAAVVTPGKNGPSMVNKAGGSDFADAPTEQHPLFAPGSRDEVWYFTQGENETVPTLHSAPDKRRGKGDDLTAQRPGFTLAGDPGSAITASALRVSPDGRKAAGFHELQGMNVVDVPRRPSVQRDDDATLHPLPTVPDGCYPWGWTNDDTVLCGERQTEDDPARKNNFWTVDTTRLTKEDNPPESVSSKPILPKTSRKNTLRALSQDGDQMVITSQQGSVTEHFTARTTPGSTPKKITAKGADRALNAGTVLEWR